MIQWNVCPIEAIPWLFLLFGLLFVGVIILGVRCLLLSRRLSNMTRYYRPVKYKGETTKQMHDRIDTSLRVRDQIRRRL